MSNTTRMLVASTLTLGLALSDYSYGSARKP